MAQQERSVETRQTLIDATAARLWSEDESELRIADIILAVDEPIATTRCKPGASKGCTKTGARCVTHDLWEELGQQIHVFLSSVSLADVVERRVLGRSRPCNDTGAIADVVAAE